MVQLRLFPVLLVALCLAACLAQESAESGEAGARGRGGAGGVGQAGTGAGGQGGGIDPSTLSGRRLQMFLARLSFVRRELRVFAQTIAEFLSLEQEQGDFLVEEILLALETVLFPPPTLPPTLAPNNFPPITQG